jgi:hypothetical protein
MCGDVELRKVRSVTLVALYALRFFRAPSKKVREMGIKGLTGLITDEAPGAIKEHDIKVGPVSSVLLLDAILIRRLLSLD